MPEETLKITNEDVESTAQKLATFSQSLTANEKAVIDWILARVTSTDTDSNDAGIPGVLSGIEPATRGAAALGAPQSGAVSRGVAQAMGLPTGVGQRRNEWVSVTVAVG